ncbi:MAG TPA: hypothetical protein VM938_14000 [Acidimicrobiales bacterium]|nr:hypothetical protein [Acidimicrobiales bacterium]
MKSRKFTSLLIATLVCALAVGGCSRSDTGVSAVGADPSERAPGDPHGPAPETTPGPEYDGNHPDPQHVHDEPGVGVYDWAPPPNFAKFVQWSHAAVIGRVTAIAPPRWNTTDNQPDEHGVMFRDAQLAVEEVIYNAPELPATVGTTVTVRLTGDGSETGPATHGAEPIRHLNAIAGPVAAGDKVLWVLGMDDFPFRGGTTEKTPRLVYDYFGAWRITSELLALNPQPLRTVPLAPLVAKLKAVRAAPPSTGNTGTQGKLNPIE